MDGKAFTRKTTREFGRGRTAEENNGQEAVERFHRPGLRRTWYVKGRESSQEYLS